MAQACDLRAGKAEAYEAMGLPGGPTEPDLQAVGQGDGFKSKVDGS